LVIYSIIDKFQLKPLQSVYFRAFLLKHLVSVFGKHLVLASRPAWLHSGLAATLASQLAVSKYTIELAP
jgi:hypothetical protein